MESIEKVLNESPVEEEKVEERVEEAGYRIEDDFMADKAIQRIKKVRANVERFREHFNEQLAKIEKEADGICAFYTAHLERYFGSVPHKVTKTQESYELPSGKLIRKNQEPEYVRDDTKIIDFIRWDNPDLINTKESLNWSGFKKTFTIINGECFDSKTGEKIPGISVVYREPKFDLKIKEDDENV